VRNETIDETNNATIAKQYTDWHIKHGGFARDMTMRDHYAGLAMQGLLANPKLEKQIIEGGGAFGGWIELSAYGWADAMLKERIK
jgi:hypothetical protein